MTALKRLSDQLISSDGEEMEPPPCKIHRRKATPPAMNIANAKTSSRQAFADFLANALPTALVDLDIKELLVLQSNNRLRQAEEENIHFDDISIGPDCLPTWPGLQWDPKQESLHAVIQRRLEDYQLSQELGLLLREDLIAKANRKLGEARSLGVQLPNMKIGEGLLPEWKEDHVDMDQEGLRGEGDIGGAGTENEASSSCTLEDEELSENTTGLTSPDDSAEAELESRSGHTSSFSAHSDFDSEFDSDSDTDCDCGNTYEEEDDDFVYTIHLDNFVDSEAHVSEEPLSNILHDAEVVGGTRGFEDVDLEVYVVDDDSDVDELPELELAVDREAFEYHFETDEAVDVELPGVDVRCMHDIEVEEVPDEEESVRHPLTPRPRPRSTRVVGGNAQETIVHSMPTIVEADDDDDEDEEDMSEEVTDYEEEEEEEEEEDEEEEDEEEEAPARIIKETADGFSW